MSDVNRMVLAISTLASNMVEQHETNEAILRAIDAEFPDFSDHFQIALMEVVPSDIVFSGATLLINSDHRHASYRRFNF